MLTLGFGALDLTVLGLYFAVLAGTGAWFASRGAKDTEDYFLGGRKMPMWAVAVSVLATSLSAATFIGGPQQAYVGDLTYLSTNIGMVIAAVVIAVWFIPAFYRERVGTVYELLDKRAGAGGRRAASAMFMLGRVFASGARLFIVALPAALIVFGEPEDGGVPASQLVLAIGAMTVVGILYTLVGGISSVIWSDVIQTGVFLAAVIGAIVLLLVRIPATPAEIGEVLGAAPGAIEGSSKLTAVSLSTDFTAPYTLWSVVIGFTLLGIASYGTDQDLVQRMLTCKNAKSGSWSVISAQLMGVPVVLLFMTVGLLLYVFYARPDVMGESAPASAPDDTRTVFLSFILREMPAGMPGLMMAGLFAAGLSSLNSAINAMASTLVTDFYRPMVRGRSEKHYVLMGRAAVVGWGVVLGGFACFCVYWQRASGQTLIDFALGVMTFAYAGLLGVFFCVLFTRRGSTRSVIAALAVGFLAILVQQPIAWGVGPLAALDARTGADLSLASSLAFPWKLTIGAALAFGVAVMGRPGADAPGRVSQAESAAPTAAR